MKKIYVLDTNVLLDDPDCVIYGFDENDIVIPLMVLEELDVIKKHVGDTGFCARQAMRNIDKIRNEQNITNKLVRNDLGGTLSVITLSKEEKERYNNDCLKLEKNDDLIILSALKVRDQNKDIPTVFVSNDISARIKSSLFDIPAQHYKDGAVTKETVNYKGYRYINLPISFFGSIKDDKFTPRRMPQKITFEELAEFSELDNILTNEIILLTPEDNPYTSKNEKKKLKAVYRCENNELVKRTLQYKAVYGNVVGKNLEQSIALDFLLDDNIKVVALSGLAGAGKTFLSCVAVFTKLFLEKEHGYEKLILLKPTVSVSDDIGFLPGNVDEKLRNYMGSYMDNIKVLRKLHNNSSNAYSADNTFDKMKEKGLIEIDSISFLRGRSLSDCLIIVDEVQNITNNVAKTILTRVGENCKIILLGDPSQIDRPYLSKYNNGLSYIIEKLKGQPFFAHVKFVNGVRSIVSKTSAELL